MQDFRNLRVWQAAAKLMEDIYTITATFPGGEKFITVSQMRSAALSVTSNIAEGACRQGDAEFARFLYMAMGSANELENAFEMSIRVHLISSSEHQKVLSQITDVKRMLSGLIKTLNRSLGRPENKKQKKDDEEVK